MSISRIFGFRRGIVLWLIIPLIMWCINVPAFAQQAAQPKPRVTLKAVEVGSEYVTIKYELTAAAAEWYDVRFNLLKQGEPSFKVPVRSASGDIGVVKSSGSTLEVQWDFIKDYPQGLAGEGYYFDIVVTKASGGSNLLYYLGGGLAVAAGVAAYLVFGNKGGGAAELPAAPARPSQ